MLGRRHLATLLSLVALAFAAPAGAEAADCPGADLVPAAESSLQAAEATLCLLNAERSANGLGSLRQNAQLDAASVAYSLRMVNESFFAHQSPDGGTLVGRLTAAAYLTKGQDGWVVGENLAWGQGPLSTPRSIVAAWMNSEGHRANILSDEYTEIGIGLVPGTPTDRSWGATYTTEFGTRRTETAGALGEPRTAATTNALATHRLAVAKAKAKAKARAKVRARARAARVRAARARAAKVRAARARAAKVRAARARAAKVRAARARAASQRAARATALRASAGQR